MMSRPSPCSLRAAAVRRWRLSWLLMVVVAMAPALLGAHELEHLGGQHDTVACDLCLTGGNLHHAGLPSVGTLPGSSADAVSPCPVAPTLSVRPRRALCHARAPPPGTGPAR